MIKNKTLRNVISFCVIFIIATIIMTLMSYVFSLYRKQVINQQFSDLVQEVDDLCTKNSVILDTYDDWDQYYDYYTHGLAVSAQIIDNRDSTFAALYDTELNIISIRNYDNKYIDVPFDPLVYPEFIDAVRDKSWSGTLTINNVLVINKKHVYRPYDVYFRILPSIDVENYVILVVSKPRVIDNVVVPTYFTICIYSVFIILSISIGVFMFSHKELWKALKQNRNRGGVNTPWISRV